MKSQDFKIGSEVLHANAVSVCVIIEIKGATATISEKATGEIYKKRLSSLRLYESPNLQWTEQEIAGATAVYNHGDTVFSCLQLDSNGVTMVWDAIKNDTVPKNELTKI